MSLTPVKLFSSDPQKARSMGAFDAISLFNDAVLPHVNSLLPEEDPVDVDAEFALATSRRQERAAFDEEASVFTRRRDEALYASLRSGQSEERATPTSDPGEAPDTEPYQGADPAYDTSRDLTDIVKDFEGFTAKPVWDYKQSSIGYGTKARKGDTLISKGEANRRLKEELNLHRKLVVEHATKHGYKFSPRQLDALTSFNFNTGRLEQLTNNGRRTPEEIASRIPQYRKAGGKVLPGLVKRRQIEQKLFTGE